MQKKIFSHTLVLNLIALVVTFVVSSMLIYYQLQSIYFNNLENELNIVQSVYRSNGQKGLKELSIDDRISVIDQDGRVIYDNGADLKELENHSQRPEIIYAKKTGKGESIRDSDTLLTRNFYSAHLLKNKQIIRIATTDTNFLQTFIKLILMFVALMIVMAIIIYYLSLRFAKKLVKPINNLNIDQLENNNDFYQELYPLVNRLKTQKVKIASQVNELSQKQKELTLITTHMSEGIILLDAKDHILMANPKACALVGINQDLINKPLTTIKDIDYLINAIQTSRNHQNDVSLFEKDHRVYRVFVNAVYEKAEYVGTVIFIFDITDSYTQESMRKEFTANVSHELKTPLTSISGFAELMSAGLVSNEDTQRFAGKIYNESQRLLSLVNDIMQLSQLESNQESVMMPINFASIFEQIKMSLQSRLDANHQQLILDYQEIPFIGYQSVIHDIVYNLVENASKYSGNNSTIKVKLENQEHQIQIIVSDNGPGIKQSDMERIFERFYRGDKSHSSEIEGTGLGLSIVKHSVILHKGKIDVSNNPTGGAMFKITLPKQNQ